MTLRKSIIMLLVGMPLLVKAQSARYNVVGVVTDSLGAPIPFVSVFVEQLNSGTMTDEHGQYSLSLPAAKHYSVFFQAVGYNTQKNDIEVYDDTRLDVEMHPLSVNIEEVTVAASEDPAYPIMRKAIVNAPLHLSEVNSYTAKSYIKGSLVFDKIPSLVRNSHFKENRTYTLENVSQIAYVRPNRITQTVLSEKNSLTSFDMPDNIILKYFSVNLYNTQNNELFISPLSPKAFTHYRFRYEGYITSQNEQIINVVRVTPKYLSKQLFEGYIRIVDDTWELEHVDLSINTAIGEVRFVQNYFPIDNKIWMPLVNDYTANISAMGVAARLRYVGNLNYEDVDYLQVSEKLSTASTINTDSLADVLDRNTRAKRYKRNVEKLSETLSKDDFTKSDIKRANRLARRDKVLSDTSFRSLESKDIVNYTIIDTVRLNNTLKEWAGLNIEPLSDEEQRGYLTDDSLRRAGNIRPLFKNGKSIVGAQKFDVFTHSTLSISGIDDDFIYYHPTTGLGLEQTLRFDSDVKNVDWFASLKLSYAIGAKEIFSELAFGAKFPHTTVEVKSGNEYADWKRELGVNRLSNSMLAFFFKHNNKVLVDRKYREFNVDVSPMWGWNIKASVLTEHLSTVSNVANFSVFRNSYRFHSNVPKNDRLDAYSLNNVSQSTASISIEYTPRLRYYVDKKGEKKALGSRFPTIYLGVTQGLGKINDGASSFTHFYGALSHKKAYTINDRFDWEISAGGFTNTENMSFLHWKHFYGSKKPFGINDAATGFAGYVMFPPYALSTNEWYVAMRLKYQSQRLLLKRIPALGNWLYTEELYLRNSVIQGEKVYSEYGYGIGNILMIMRLGVFMSFIDGKYQGTGLRVAIGPSK